MIYFVRHGQTDYNKKGIVQGHKDIPLNEIGLAQAEKLSENLKDVHIDVIYSSPLSRARVTAETINRYHNVDIIFDDGLKEFFAGRVEDMSLDKEAMSRFLADPKMFGAESHEEFYDRVVESYKKIDCVEDKDILIVAHGGVYRSIYRYIHGISNPNANIRPLQNCEYIVLKKA